MDIGLLPSVLQAFLSWLQDNSSSVQVVTAILQAAGSVAAIPVAIVAARWGASRAYKLQNRKEGEKLDEQVKSLRLLLGLEVQRDFKLLQKFRGIRSLRLAAADGGADDAGNAGGGAERRSLLATRQYITSHLPVLSSRLWHSQHLSPLLPVALSPAEIRQTDDIYSNFERLAQIKLLLAEKAAPRAAGAAAPPDEVLTWREIEDLSNEFEAILDVTLHLSNPFQSSLDDMGGATRAAELGEGVRALR